MGLEACWVGSSTALKMRGRLTTEGTQGCQGHRWLMRGAESGGLASSNSRAGGRRIEGGKFIAMAASAQARQPVDCRFLMLSVRMM